MLFQGIIKHRWKCILSGHHAVFPQNFDICLNLTESLHAMVVSFSRYHSPEAVSKFKHDAKGRGEGVWP
jgi:hypothetical protein